LLLLLLLLLEAGPALALLLLLPVEAVEVRSCGLAVVCIHHDLHLAWAITLQVKDTHRRHNNTFDDSTLENSTSPFCLHWVCCCIRAGTEHQHQRPLSVESAEFVSLLRAY
jgi:hypothetical protein